MSTPLWETHVFVELYCLVSKDLNIDQVDNGIDPFEAEGITLSKAASILQNVDQDVEKETLLLFPMICRVSCLARVPQRGTGAPSVRGSTKVPEF